MTKITKKNYIKIKQNLAPTKPRSLDLICETIGQFQVQTEGNVYCSLSLSKPINCKYHSKEKDHNKLYTCQNPLYQYFYKKEELHTANVLFN